jgi:hypothetical protein
MLSALLEYPWLAAIQAGAVVLGCYALQDVLARFLGARGQR